MQTLTCDDPQRDHDVTALVQAGMVVAVRTAHIYLCRYSLTAEPDALTECLRSHVEAAYESAMCDAQEALDCGLKWAALATFKASMAIAGIAAAKECGFPAKRAPA